MRNLLTKRTLLPGLGLVLMLAASLACSVGRLLVEVPTPTAQPTKTPRPTFTFTPDWTPTPLPTPTVTLTPIQPSDTPTLEASATPEAVAVEAEPPTNTPPPAPPTEAPPPPPPADTPTPEPPTATPAPAYPFVCQLITHPTGNPQFTYITGSVHKWVDQSQGNAAAQTGYVLVIVSPAGEYTSTVSGPGTTDSRGPGLGDNHAMNMKVEFAPYTPGEYRGYLALDGQPASNEIQFTMLSDPQTYAHFLCIDHF
jgi:hypothetical protein